VLSHRAIITNAKGRYDGMSKSVVWQWPSREEGETRVVTDCQQSLGNVDVYTCSFVCQIITALQISPAMIILYMYAGLFLQCYVWPHNEDQFTVILFGIHYSWWRHSHVQVVWTFWQYLWRKAIFMSRSYLQWASFVTFYPDTFLWKLLQFCKKYLKIIITCYELKN